MTEGAQEGTGGRNFWDARSLEELAREQGVGPHPDLRALFGTWPGEDDDRFEEIVAELRHPNAVCRHS
jgi:hypothetical protein